MGVALHLRLGDLLSLDEKNPINPNRIASALKEICVQQHLVRVAVFSDSPKITIEYLGAEIPLGCDVKLEDSQNSYSVLRKKADYEVFMGTNSKASI
jgi:hypothetical protein